jgi:hypothetical protein
MQFKNNNFLASDWTNLPLSFISVVETINEGFINENTCRFNTDPGFDPDGFS